ncbi:neurexin-4 isoform X1 [Phlebotomus papatasi]|uniref:neurexin-4 isoform X1 n=1 Tax=Phlebotomus papatasi TaxID=29031 RepID=UPI00248388CA|nr:neurexin-4 isoform X1 [Phlebotomus papatasi]
MDVFGFILILLGIITQHHCGAEYYENDYYSEYECNYPLLEHAALSATSALRERGPNNARLDAGTSWTARSSDFDQQLIIDLGNVKNVTRIAIQGRPHSTEYVTEFSISYGSNGLDYTDYKEAGGNTKLFKGNTDGDSIRHNVFEVPIIAQWVRINPTRWRDRISLRAELYGCDYYPETLSFNGSSLVKLDLMRDPIVSYRESIRFRFKTSNPIGILLYSRGTQGDYLAVQIRDNRMILNINLGSGLMTTLSVGSLLDDNVWHDAVISRNRRDIVFSVDRVMTEAKIKGDFTRLDLNRGLYIGGVPYHQEGMVVHQNYTGCIENLYLNASNFIRELKEAIHYGEALRFDKIHTMYTCPEPPIMPVTFLTRASYAKMRGYEGMKQLNVSFWFRTFEEKGLLLYHEFNSKGFVKLYLEEGVVKVDLKTDDYPAITLRPHNQMFNDGRWHSLVLTLSQNKMVLDINRRPADTERLMSILTGGVYYIGGGKTRDGFIGCMRMISVDGNYRLPTDWKDEDYCCKNEVIFNACQMTDRCNPNPCKHDGICRQNSMEFFCDCQNTGYAGAVCHTSLNPLSCVAYKNVQSVHQRANINIDVDGSGPLKPFPVTCEFYADGRVITVLSHSQEHSTTVDGFQEPGSYRQDIIYEAELPEIMALLNRSHTCWQRLSYACRSSRLMNSPSDELNFHPYAWWVSRNNQRMNYWAGGVPGSRRCECGVWGTCYDPTKWCNCDSNYYNWLEDSGELREKEHLPVKAVQFGDTGTPLDEKFGRYTLGPLMCEGDDLFNNVVTFRITDATINLPRFDMGHSGDIYLEFRTTIENAVLFHAKGPTDYIKLSIIGGKKLQFQYQAGSGPLGVNVETSYHLNDNNWHSVSVERNRKEARLVVDGALKAEVREPPGPVRAIYLTSELVIGASYDYRDGYVGCIRALLLNGELVDLKYHARNGLYGVSTGCMGRCESNPCLNNGTCFERYDGYTCDCRWSAFKGPICADEIGVNLRSSSMIKYDFLGSWRSTIRESIRVGFTTTNPKGFLLGFYSNSSKEYLTIMVSNSGHLRVVFDFGFERQELIYPDKHFGLGQYHDVKFSRKNSGATVVLEVDNYAPQEYDFDIKDSADAQFNNIEYMYIGKNESMSDGFVGCVSRVEFDDIYPLKLLFQQNPPENVKSLGTPLTEDFCGVEPVTHPPIEIETRPPPEIDQDKLRRAYNQVDSAILGSVLAILFLLLLIMGILIGRYLARHKGEYLTQEDKGADAALDPDEAVVHSTTGHQVTKRKEWFI